MPPRPADIESTLRILLITAALAAFMLVAKDGRVLERARLTGSCSAVAAPAGDPAPWQACRSGQLEGRPDLSRRSCTSESVVGDLEYWRCPAPVVAGHSPEA